MIRKTLSAYESTPFFPNVETKNFKINGNIETYQMNLYE